MGVLRLGTALLGLVGLGLVVGCGGNALGRYPISGSVKVDGAPLDKGNISFQPVNDGQTSTGAVISGGNFSVPRDKGLPPGMYRVEINAAAGGGGGTADTSTPPGEAPPPPKELIPAEWNESSTHTIEVKKEGPFNFSFEIATKGK